MCPAAISTAMPSGYLHSVTRILRSEPSGLSETTRSSLRSRRNRRPAVALSLDSPCGFGVCELTMCLTPGNQLGSEPDAGFTDSIVELAADVADVPGDSDRRRRLCALTTESRPSHACGITLGRVRFAPADCRFR